MELGTPYFYSIPLTILILILDVEPMYSEHFVLTGQGDCERNREPGPCLQMIYCHHRRTVGREQENNRERERKTTQREGHGTMFLHLLFQRWERVFKLLHR